MSDSVTFGALVEMYLRYQSQTVKRRTVARNRSVMNTFIRLLGADADVNKLTAGIVRDRLLQYTTSPTTVNEYTSRFKSMIRWGYQNDLILDISWLDKLTRLKDKSKREKVEDKYLEREECEELLDSMQREDFRALTEFLILTGLRIGEALALNETDFDFSRRTISVTKTFDFALGTTDTPKTATSVREVYMQDDLLAFSRALFASNRKKRKLLYLDRSPVFFQPDGRYMSYNRYREYLKRQSVAVLGREITPHTLRHTHASLLAEAGLPYEAIAHRLGHANSRITKEIYIHITKKRKEKENELIREVALL